jgi:LacI family transcriptional regulator
MHTVPVASKRRQEVITLRDVAKRAGVNVATASRALSDDRRDLVSDETASRVVEAARELSYRPNPIARGLKTNRSYTVGVLIPDLTNPLYPPIVRGIDDALGPLGYTPLVANTDNDASRERMSYDALRTRIVDGFVIATAFRRHPLVDEAIAADVPLVLVLRNTDARNAWAVCVDERAGVTGAVEHLHEQGHRRIGHVAGPQVMSPAFERFLGFTAAAAELGIETSKELTTFAEAFSIAEGRRACRELLERGAGPTAIIAANDLLALGCLDALGEAGLRCPQDVSIIGYNDMPFAERFMPPLTSVRIPGYELGLRGASVLLDRISGEDSTPRTEMLSPRLVVRASTAPPKRTRPAGRRRAVAPTR